MTNASSSLDPNRSASTSAPAVKWHRLATSLGIAFWALGGLLIPIAMAIVAILYAPRYPLVLIGGLLCYFALVAVIYKFESDLDNSRDI